MFPSKHLIRKLKHLLIARRALSQLLYSVCFVLFVWFIWSHCPRHYSVGFAPGNLQNNIRFPECSSTPKTVLDEVRLRKLSLKINKLNLKAKVFNTGRYGAVTASTTVIAIQVHEDVVRLQQLIVSLAQVKYIESVLLIFSHSYYDKSINKLIKSIQFCKYMQIYYPYSLQLYPNGFPGENPDENAAPRVAGTEHKHHWWWKAYFIFDNLQIPNTLLPLKNIVVFLEEDDYVLPDFMYMLLYARRTLEYFPTAHVIAMGRPFVTGLDYDTILVDRWTPMHDRGLAFNRSTWKEIWNRADRYCMYDDSSWSYSLMHVFNEFPSGLADVAAMVAPRVVSTRSDGSGARAPGGQALFPAAVRAVVMVGPAGRVRRPWRPPPHGNGGWADQRDQLLCLDPLGTSNIQDY